MSSEERIRPNLSMVALASFIASFMVARVFTTLNPDVWLTSGGFHIHHFWYGLAMLVIGGWLGISYRNERVDRLAAILFGAGGGLIGDEVGLLLTFGNYWTGITYTLMTIFLTFVSMLVLFNRYSKIIRVEFTHLLSSHVGLYFGVFLAAVSMAFLLETDNTIVVISSSIATIAACIIILVYFVQHMRRIY